MTIAILGFGVQFQIGDGASPEAFTTLDELVDASPPGVSRAPVDGTHMGSEARFMLFLSGLRDGGEIPLVFHYSAETYEVLIGEYLIDAVRKYRVVAPDGYYWEFDGFVTQLEAPPPIDDVWEINVTIKVSGKPSFIPPPSAPELLSAPVISGLAVEGALLSATTGTWDGYPVPTFTYQWKRDGVSIGGATASTYTTTGSDGDTTITVVVTATNDSGSVSATSNAIAIADAVTLPTGAILDFWSEDGTGTIVPNRASGLTPSTNMIAYSSGVIPNAGTGATPTHRHATGPSGNPNTAVRVVGTAGQSFSFFTGAAPAAGTYTRGVKLRASPGTGPFTLEARSINTMVSQSVTDAAWVTFSETFAASGSNHSSFYITSATNYDVLVDEAQLVSGSSLPAWATDETFSGAAKRNPAYLGLPLASGLVDNTTWRPATARVAASGQTVSFAELTAVATFEQNTSSNNGALLQTIIDTASSTTAATFVLGATTNGAVVTTPAPINLSLVNLLNQGLHTVSIRLKNGNREVRFDGVEISIDTSAWAGFIASFIGLHGALTGSRLNGKWGRITLWNRYLTDAEMIEATLVQQLDIAAMGLTPGLSSNFWFSEGDSRNTPTRSSWDQYPKLLSGGTAPTEFTPTLNSIGMAVGGSTLSIMVARLPTLLRRVGHAVDMGINPIVSVHIGTNDSTELLANPAAYWARIKTEFINPLRAAGAKVIACTEYAQNETDKPGWAAGVMGTGGFNDIIRADTTAYDALCDWSVDAIMGDAANFPSIGGTYSQDGIHPNGAGHLRLKPYMKAALASVMV